MKSLKGKIAVVAGATRGCGRGIARALREAGATVYCTGRSARGTPSPYKRPETIEETAEMVTAAGGVGIAARIDHSVEAEVKALFERVASEQGQLDVLVNSIAGQDPMLGGWGNEFWETDLSNADAVFRQTLLSHVITAKYAAPLMIKKRRGLIVEITEGDFLTGGYNVLHDLVKSGTKALVLHLAEALHKHRVAAIAIAPGFLRSEMMLEIFGVTEATWRDAGKKDKNFLESESPLYIGRAVAALAADKKKFEKTGDVTSSWELAREYGFTDYDGRKPDWGKHFEKIASSLGMTDGLLRHIELLDRFKRRAKRYVGKK